MWEVLVNVADNGLLTKLLLITGDAINTEYLLEIWMFLEECFCLPCIGGNSALEFRARLDLA